MTGTGHRENSGSKAGRRIAVAALLEILGALLCLAAADGPVSKKQASGIITTVAGTGFSGYSGDSGAATQARLNNPADIAIDGSGNLYIADWGNERVRKVDGRTGLITTVAGTGEYGYSGDGGAATRARLALPSAVAIDGSGNLYIADFDNHRVRKVGAVTGLITTVAGTGLEGYGGDGGRATQARLNNPADIAIDGSGNLYIADWGNERVRKVDGRTGLITTVAGTGEYGYSGDGGPATQARLNFAAHVVIDGSGNLYITDVNNHRVRKVEAATGLITTVAGTGLKGYGGDGGAATQAPLDYPHGVAVDGSGNLYIADWGNHRVRMVSRLAVPVGGVSGSGGADTGNGGRSAGTATVIEVESSLAGRIAAAGEVDHYRFELGAAMRVEVYTTGGTDTFGRLNGSASDDDSGAGLNFRIEAPVSAGTHFVQVSGYDSVETGDYVLHVRALGGSRGSGTGTGGGAGGAIAPGIITTVADGTAVAIAEDGSGDLYTTGAIEDDGGVRVRKFEAATGLITTVAGTGEYGYSGDGGPATQARLSFPFDLAIDGAGNLYIADRANERVRKVEAATGLITTVAGTGEWGYSGDGGAATEANLAFPLGLAVDGSGNLYIADSDNSRVRKVEAATGLITTVAGTGEWGYSGDGGAATEANLAFPLGLAVDGSGNLYIADSDNSRVRKVEAATGLITTVAGTGEWGYSGDGGPAIQAQLSFPVDLAIDGSGSLYIADQYNHRVRKVEATTGLITTVAGTGAEGYNGDGGPATQAQLGLPGNLAIDGSGNLYIANGLGYGQVRMVSRVAVPVGGGSGGSGSGGSGSETGVVTPDGREVQLGSSIAGVNAGGVRGIEEFWFRLDRSTTIEISIIGDVLAVLSTGVDYAEVDIGYASGTLNLPLRESLAAGTYFIRISSAFSEEAYTLRVRSVDGGSGGSGTGAGGGSGAGGAGDGDDHGDSGSVATEVRLGSSTTGALEYLDQDWFRFRLDRSATVEVLVTSDDPTLHASLLDGPSLISDEIDLALVNSPVRMTLAAGTYYVAIRAVLWISEYTLRVRSVDGGSGGSGTGAGGGSGAGGAGDGDDHGDSGSVATEVRLGSSTTGALEYLDQDWFRFRLDRSATVEVLVTSDDPTLHASLLDGPSLISDEIDLALVNSPVRMTLAAGTYYVAIRAVLWISEYTLRVRSVDGGSGGSGAGGSGSGGSGSGGSGSGGGGGGGADPAGTRYGVRTHGSSGVTISGSGSYSMSGNRVTIEIDKVSNNSQGGRTGTLKVHLYATTASTPFARGYWIASASFAQQFVDSGRLPGRSYFSDVSLTTELSRPPAGTYNVFLLITQYPEDRKPLVSAGFSEQLVIP